MIEHARKRLSKRAKKGFRGWPVATVALYGPDDTTATKLPVGIVPAEDAEATDLRRWLSKDQTDIRDDIPVAEEVRASTAIAERVGELRILDLLNRFVADVSLAVAEAGGEIHKYVGDEVIATWRLAPGANRVDCVRACFGAFDRIDAQRSAYERDFGLVPDFRAGLHCGPVAVGELAHRRGLPRN